MSSNVAFLVVRKADFTPWYELYLGGNGLARTIDIATEESEKIYLKDGGFVIKGTQGNLVRFMSDMKIYGGYGEAALEFVRSSYAAECECFIRVE